MKGVVAVSLAPAKRRWRTAAAARVLVLVLLSLLVPLAFLLGFHNRFPSGYLTDERSRSESRFRSYGHLNDVLDLSEDHGSTINNLIKRFKPTLSKDNAEYHTYESGDTSHKKHVGKVIRDSVRSTLEGEDKTISSSPKNLTSQSKLKNGKVHYEPEAVKSQPKVFPMAQQGSSDQLPASRNGGNSVPGDESGKSCQVEFGSYCLWLVEHKEVMKDSTVKTLKDQLFVARAYYPSVAKLHGEEKLSRELKQNIQEHERMLSEAIVDAELPLVVRKKIQKMDQTIAEAKSCTLNCNNVNKKLGQILDLTEDEANFHMKQSAFLYRLAVQTIPKSLHCLSMRLTVEYFRSSLKDLEHLDANKIKNSTYMHVVIFSKNILAASVVINSTVTNSEVVGEMIFHIVTSAQNYYAMKLWFAKHSFKEATIHVINFEELNLKRFFKNNLVQLSLSEEFRVSLRENDLQAIMQLRTEYISTFSHSHFFLSEIFKSLKKVIVLDDDVVVQRDLSSLWNLNLQGKVNGAVEFCGLRLGQLQTNLGRHNYNTNSCTWMSGVNVIDLEKWREHNVTAIYHQLVQDLQTSSELSWRVAALPASLLAFKDLIHPLDSSWSVSGLGHDYGVSENAIKSAATLHYNGNMKPWLDMGIPKYKKFWKKFLTHEEPFMKDCNVNP